MLLLRECTFSCKYRVSSTLTEETPQFLCTSVSCTVLRTRRHEDGKRIRAAWVVTPSYISSPLRPHGTLFEVRRSSLGGEGWLRRRRAEMFSYWTRSHMRQLQKHRWDVKSSTYFAGIPRDPKSFSDPRNRGSRWAWGGERDMILYYLANLYRAVNLGATSRCFYSASSPASATSGWESTALDAKPSGTWGWKAGH